MQHFPDQRLLLAGALLALSITGCEAPESNPAPAKTTGSADTSLAQPTEEWLGKWIGPEGTFLLLEGGAGKYQVTIQNLDGPRTFQGVAAGDRIAFERDGVTEHLHATNGADTGMKWLSEKSNCLTVRSGEGYCRD
ncbi:hypothetical protein [Pseudomonas sp. Gutcm_11s]|uniref:hypothetical protein n=1 Tax=Pseudomonas sp. Gutcm_11s TaxID=3026088 RepID=UPI00235FF5B8|nr:hypothetical protein [Pseudomonas sp. Gutcm_11s]MDD0843553.1 hypothetical protein [Pseudomonas sp. Gutcm_11s]